MTGYVVQVGPGKDYLIEVKQQEVRWTPSCIRPSLAFSDEVPEMP